MNSNIFWSSQVTKAFTAARALLLLAFLTITQAGSLASEIWNGGTITFSKADFADWTLPENQDAITAGVILTRANNQGIFNIAEEAGYGGSSPANTLWALGTTALIERGDSLNFDSWHAFVDGDPPFDGWAESGSLFG